MNDAPNQLQDETNKRITLNLLIQGAAQHAFLTSHYLVRDELNAIDPKLVRLYDQVALGGFVQYWSGEMAMIFGWPDRFWRRASRPKHPFCRHPFLVRHGLGLALSAKQRAYQRCREKGVHRTPLYFSIELLVRMLRTMHRESKHKEALVALAKRTTYQVWGIPMDRLDGALTRAVGFGQPRPPKTFKAIFLRSGTVGYGGVLPGDSEFVVVGKAAMWPILSHELVKGTVELICMHGLNQLDAITYREVVNEADRPEYEPWMLQVGCELWRQLLALLPHDRPVAEMVMHIARLDAAPLERLMFAVAEDQDRARVLLAGL